jgi:oligopeptide transport system substrate-binding protein
MRANTRNMAVAGAAGFALILSACGGGDDSGNGDEGGAAGPEGTAVIYGCNPENPLIPSMTNEVCGGDPLDFIFSKLVRYNPDDGLPQNEVAESIESEDNQLWTITLQDGWTFHDGSPVTAESFVNAWNWSADGANGALNSYFYEPIEGFAESQGEIDEETEEIIEGSTSDTLSGLAIVDDLTFTVQLTEPASNFPNRLGYTAFAPLPDVFFDDTEAFGEAPIGSGPFELVSYERDNAFELAAYDGYNGETQPQVENVTFKIFTDANAAYADLLADNIDVFPTLPPNALTGEQYKSDLGDRWVRTETGIIQTITFAPADADPDMDNPDLRKAISLAIDRQLIIDNIFAGERTPATGWVSPVVGGYQEGACGEWCEYNPDRAKEMLEQSGYEGGVTLSYNPEGDNKAWVDAACNSISNALEIECTPNEFVDFGTFRAAVNARRTGEPEMTGMFRTGWQMDYPHIENFLVPLYATGASANDGDYSNEEFDSLVSQAASASSDEEAIELYQQAEALLAEDMPAIPTWYQSTITGYSSNIENVKISPFSTVDPLSLSVNS